MLQWWPCLLEPAPHDYLEPTPHNCLEPTPHNRLADGEAPADVLLQSSLKGWSLMRPLIPPMNWAGNLHQPISTLSLIFSHSGPPGDYKACAT